MLTFDQPAAYYLVIALGAFLVGLSKAGLGGAMGILITPLVSLVIPADQAVGLMLPVLMLGDMFALAAHWQRWEARLLRGLLPGAVLGVTLGTFVLTSITPLALRRSMAALIIVFIFYRLFEARIRSLRLTGNHRLGVAVGALAGFTSTLAHAGGPLITIYLLLQDLAPRTFIATSVLFLALLNWIKVPYYWAAGMFDWQAQWQLAWLLPAVPLGAWVGRRLAQRISKPVFDGVILALLVVTAIFLLR